VNFRDRFRKHQKAKVGDAKNESRRLVTERFQQIHEKWVKKTEPHINSIIKFLKKTFTEKKVNTLEIKVTAE